MKGVEYHLQELEIVFDKEDSRRILPEIRNKDKSILDIGCGIGQSLIALKDEEKFYVGIDVDQESIAYGQEKYGDIINFIVADACMIPIRTASFDLVYSRVSLPYTNIPKTLMEIRRVLRSDGRLWLTFHSKEMTVKLLYEDIGRLNIVRVVYRLYVLLNGYLLKHFNVLVPFVDGTYESWQDTENLMEQLDKLGFSSSTKKIGTHWVIEGHL